MLTVPQESSLANTACPSFIPEKAWPAIQGLCTLPGCAEVAQWGKGGTRNLCGLIDERCSRFGLRFRALQSAPHLWPRVLADIRNPHQPSSILSAWVLVAIML